jgi:hypothetical protein
VLESMFNEETFSLEPECWEAARECALEFGLKPPTTVLEMLCFPEGTEYASGVLAELRSLLRVK